MAWLNSEITWAANEGSEALLEIIGQKAERFNAINVATALHRLARCYGDGNKELAENEAYGSDLWEWDTVTSRLKTHNDPSWCFGWGLN